MGYKTWIYHETEKPKIVDSDETKSYFDDGWKDSPRYFVKTTDFGVSADDPIAVQQLGETIEGVKDALNGALNLDKMTLKELDEYADTNYGNTLKGKTKAKKIEEIEALLNG